MPATMQAGEEFPPVVLWNESLIDGNTRLHALRKAGRASTPAYRVDCKNERQAKQLAASLNQTNGRRLNPEEARLQAVTMLDDGYADSFVARELGIEPSKVRRWRKETEAVERAERLGLADRVKEISATDRAKLAEITHDAPFQAAVKAFTTYDVPSAEVKEIFATIKKASSDEDAVALVESRAEVWEPRGIRRQGRGPRVVAREAYKSIGALTKHDAAYWVDMTEMQTALPKWEALLVLAQSVLVEYSKAATGEVQTPE
jgi:hypothetical protein